MLKAGLSWLAVLAGLTAGIFDLVLFGTRPILGYAASWREWFFNIAIGVLGMSCMAASLVAPRNRKRAGLVLAIPPIAVWAAASVCGSLARESVSAEILSAVPAVLALFWWATYKLRWPSLIAQKRRPFWLKAAMGAIVLFILTAMVLIGAIANTLRFPDIGDCGEGPPVARKYGRAVFVARIVYVSSLLGAVAVVQENFWGLPQRFKLVFLKTWAKPGDVWFVDGRRGEGLLTRSLLPVIDMSCSRSRWLQDAAVDLRVARDNHPAQGVRIIGQAVKSGTYDEVVPGVKVVITGPQGTITTTTDQQGIYDVTGLPPGQYTVRADIYSNRLREYPSCPRYLMGSAESKSGDVIGCTLRID